MWNRRKWKVKEFCRFNNVPSIWTKCLRSPKGNYCSEDFTHCHSPFSKKVFKKNGDHSIHEKDDGLWFDSDDRWTFKHRSKSSSRPWASPPATCSWLWTTCLTCKSICTNLNLPEVFITFRRKKIWRNEIKWNDIKSGHKISWNQQLERLKDLVTQITWNERFLEAVEDLVNKYVSEHFLETVGLMTDKMAPNHRFGCLKSMKFEKKLRKTVHFEPLKRIPEQT